MFGSGEMVVVLAVIMMLFGSSQIPKLAKNLGLAQKELKDALSGDDDDSKDDTPKKAPENTDDVAVVEATTDTVSTQP